MFDVDSEVQNPKPTSYQQQGRQMSPVLHRKSPHVMMMSSESFAETEPSLIKSLSGSGSGGGGDLGGITTSPVGRQISVSSVSATTPNSNTNTNTNLITISNGNGNANPSYDYNFNKNSTRLTHNNNNGFNNNNNNDSLNGKESRMENNMSPPPSAPPSPPPPLSASVERYSEYQQSPSSSSSSSSPQKNSKSRQFKLELRAEDVVKSEKKNETKKYENKNKNNNLDERYGDGSPLNDSSTSTSSTIRVKTVPLSLSLSQQYSPTSSQASSPLSSSTPKNQNQTHTSSSSSSGSKSKSVREDFVITEDTPPRLSSAKVPLNHHNHHHHNSSERGGGGDSSNSSSSSTISSGGGRSPFTRKFNNSATSSPFKSGIVPHLTFSPETPPPLQSSSSPPIATPSPTQSSTSTTKLFGDLEKMKSTPGGIRHSLGGSGNLNNHHHHHHHLHQLHHNPAMGGGGGGGGSGASAFLSDDSPNGLSVLDVSVSSSSSASSASAPAGHSNQAQPHAGNLSGGILNDNYATNLHHTTNNHSHSSSNISSTEENFECVGEGTESLLDSQSEHTSLQYSRDVNDLSSLSVPGDSSGGPPIRRNTWLRTSLRKSPQHQPGSLPNGESMGHRRWGSFRNSSGTKRTAVTSSSALANQLYRSSSFHSSGRSSAGDGEEMYSDGSLEDEVIDLTQKVHHLEEKFSVLAENQTDVDDRYVRIKQENAELSTKLFIAEESLRDVEQRGDEKLRDEQRRFKDTLARADREKQLQIENYDIRLRSSEKDLEQVKGEVTRVKQKLERERSERMTQSDKLMETERELSNVREDNRSLMEALRKERDSYVLEAATSQQALQELKKEFETLRKQKLMESGGGSALGFRHGHPLRFNSVDSESETSELKSRLTESEEENKRLKKQNLQLQETNEELSAQILNHGLEEGRHLLTVNKNVGDVGNSLAAEFEAMSQEQLKKALKEQTEVNDQLRTYIDGILLNIVENYPQLLEVKNKSGGSSLETSS